MAVALVLAPSMACAASAASAPDARGTSVAVTAGWRVTKFLPSVAMGGLSVSGPRNAWLAGELCDAGGLCDHLIVRHWDGMAWRAVAPPKGISGTVDDAGIGAVAASSASNAWVFNTRGEYSVTGAIALHWTGKSWGPTARFAAYIDAAVTLSATDTWAFGSPASDLQGGYIAHFNGKTWSHARFPVLVDDVSALSADDIWIAGSASDVTGASVVIEHWNGKAWHETPVPNLGIRPNSWVGVGVTAATSRDVWADVATQNSPTGTSFYLLHWNGRAWTRVAFGCAGSAVSGPVPDGHGGVWLASATGENALRPTEWFCHDSNGHWTKTAVPKRAGQQPGIDSLAWIPGTRSLWATGGFDADAGEAILKFGP